MALHARDIDNRKAQCRVAIRALSREVGRTPSEREYKEYAAKTSGAPTVHQLRYDYGQWTNAVIDAGLAPLPVDPPRFQYTESELVDEFVRVSNDLGRIPPLELFRRNSKHSNRPYQSRWGKWRDVQQYFVDNYSDRFRFASNLVSQKQVNSKQTPLKYECALRFEPRNEFETIALFSIMASDLGYRINSIRADFPDAVVEEDGIEIQVEFEYLSSNYKLHCHPLSPEFVCVCWRNDCDLGPVRVIALEDILHEQNANNPMNPSK